MYRRESTPTASHAAFAVYPLVRCPRDGWCATSTTATRCVGCGTVLEHMWIAPSIGAALSVLAARYNDPVVVTDSGVDALDVNIIDYWLGVPGVGPVVYQVVDSHVDIYVSHITGTRLARIARVMDRRNLVTL